MPRVLRILNRLIIGGPSLNATYLTKYMSPEYDTQLVIGGKDDHEQDATFLADNLGIPLTVIPEMKRAININNDRAAYAEIKKIIKDFKPDIVHTHAAKSGAIGRLAASHCNVKGIVHTFHGHVFHSYFGKLKSNTFIQIERYLAKKTDAIIAISELQKQELGNKYKICPNDKIHIIPLGLDLDKFSTNTEQKRKHFRSQYYIADDEIAIGIVGRIVPVKNHSLFIKIAAQLIQSTSKKIRFIIIGDGDMRESMEKEIQNLNIDYTYFPQNKRYALMTCTSWHQEMDVVFSGLDIVALTSHNEGTPVSLIEAQAASKPVVSTNVGGVADVVLQNESGIIVNPNDCETFSQALLSLIENEVQRKTMGGLGKEFVQRKFTYQRLVNDMKSLYHQLL
jgi:glycosyltransferase involved in cell wall biosynthesis